MSQAKIAATTKEPFENHDNALSEAQIIVGIIDHLAATACDHDSTVNPSFLSWLASEMTDRLERVELAAMAMQSVRA